MKVYIAAPWADRKGMPIIAAEVEAAGFTITHKWWLIEDVPEEARTHDILRTQAILDWEGVRSANAVLLINSAKSEGKAVEQGLAIGYLKPIVAVGKLGEFSKNVFHYLPNYFWMDTLEAAINKLSEMKDIFDEEG